MFDDEKSLFWVNDLPDDPVFLKEYIRCQAEFLGKQLMELEILRDQCRDVRRKNQTLRELIWPSN